MSHSETSSDLLPLEPLERYMLADDSDRYPRSFVVEFGFRGALERRAFELALDATLANEPLLTASVQRRTVFGAAWGPSPQGAPVVNWLDDGVWPEALRARRIHLRQEPGLRVFIRQATARTHVFHVFHHACCDGTAALAFLGRLYAAYTRNLDARAVVNSAAVSSEQIRERRPRRDLPRRAGSRSQALQVSCRRVWDVLTTRTARLARNDAPGRLRPDADPIPFPGAVTRVLTESQTQGLKQAARCASAALNDLLLCAMFQTVCDWNRPFDPAADSACYQMAVPCDLRTPEHDHMPAASLVGFVFAKQPGRICRSRVELLAAVTERMRYAVSSRSALIMFNSIRLLSRIPGGLPLFLKSWRTQATALVSYVGDAGRRLRASFPTVDGRCIVGNLVLERIAATGPVRPGTAANLTAGTYARRLVLNLTLDPHQFTATDARQLLDMLVHRLLEHVPEARISPLETANPRPPSPASALSTHDRQ